jgi:hypothetical protein
MERGTNCLLDRGVNGNTAKGKKKMKYGEEKEDIK